LTFSIPLPKLWSCEAPELYTLLIALCSSATIPFIDLGQSSARADDVIHVEGCRLGVREVDISSAGVLRVNRVPVSIKVRGDR
jgi:beta-galactosidase/beta-glucuronidase